MKKLLFVFSILIVFSCTKKDDPKPEPEPKTTYQVVNNTPHYSSNLPYLDGSIYEIIVFCYIGDDMVRQDNLTKVTYGGGKSEEKEVPKEYTKIKVSFKFLPKESEHYNLEANNRKYIKAFTVIEKGKNNVCTLDDNTMIGESLKAMKKEINSIHQ
jgi:hypothetical protein